MSPIPAKYWRLTALIQDSSPSRQFAMLSEGPVEPSSHSERYCDFSRVIDNLQIFRLYALAKVEIYFSR